MLRAAPRHPQENVSEEPVCQRVKARVFPSLSIPYTREFLFLRLPDLLFGEASLYAVFADCSMSLNWRYCRGDERNGDPDLPALPVRRFCVYSPAVLRMLKFTTWRHPDVEAAAATSWHQYVYVPFLKARIISSLWLWVKSRGLRRRDSPSAGVSRHLVNLFFVWQKTMVAPGRHPEGGEGV